MADSDDRWEKFRQQMPVAEQWAYFDHAAVAPLSAPARAAILDWADEMLAHGDAHWDRFERRIAEVRGLAARLIHAETDEIALVKNTTEGIGLVAEGYPWQAGDNVVTVDCEFPSNVYPWQNLADRGVETRVVKTSGGRVDLQAVDAACDDRTRIVSLSWVEFGTGWRNDLNAVCELAHRRGALFFLDAIQGLGVFPLDVRKTPIDFLAADGHKWLLSPEGAGVLFVRNEHLERLRPLGVGWNSTATPARFDRLQLELKPTAARYEGGSYNMPGFMGLGASLELLLDLGTEQIAGRILELTDYACQQLTAAGAEIFSARDGNHGSGIVSFDFPGRKLSPIRRACREQHIALSLRCERLRISPHAYNNHDDIDRLVAAVQ